jgi:hypothetical protein
MCAALPPGFCPIPGAACGCDGRTYASVCDAFRADVRVASTGACGGTTDGGPPPTGCARNAECASGQVCVQMAAGCGTMMAMCTTLPASGCPAPGPACGCDGRTYANVCDAFRADVRVAMLSSCGGAPDAGPPPADASVPPTDGGPCDIVGTFAVAIGGGTGYFRFAADGTWAAASDPSMLGASPIGGTYTYAAGVLAIREGRPGMPPATGCTTDQEGRYAVGFGPTCGAFTLTLTSDACASRGMSLGGAMFTRR